jgi:tetratricopeptide (TPR) repeat protein
MRLASMIASSVFVTLLPSPPAAPLADPSPMQAACAAPLTAQHNPISATVAPHGSLEFKPHRALPGSVAMATKKLVDAFEDLRPAETQHPGLPRELSVALGRESCPAYWQIVEEYRAGHVAEAARRIAALGARRRDGVRDYLEDLLASNVPEGPFWTMSRLKSAVAMHTQIALDGFIELPSEQSEHLAVARRLVDIKRDKGKVYALPESFRKRWYLWVACSAYGVLDLVLVAQAVEAAEQVFADDADFLLTAGSLAETLAWPKLGIMGGVRIPPSPRGTSQQLLKIAEGKYRRALTLVPDLAEARLRLGRVLEQGGQSTEALETLKSLFALGDPRTTYLARLFAGAACQRLGHAADAADHYRAAVQLRPELATPHVALSYALRRDGDLAAAKSEVDAALRWPRGGDDPWWDYPFGQGYRAALLGQQFIEEARK